MIAGVNNLGILRRQELIEGVLVQSAGFAVDTDEECFVAKRFDVQKVMASDEVRHHLNPLPAFEEILQVHRPVENFVKLFDVGHPFGFGKGEKLRIQRLVGDEHALGGKLVVERQGGAIRDAVGNGILVQVAFILTAKGLEGAFAIEGFVHRGAGKADKGGVGQACHKEVAEVAASGTVGPRRSGRRC